MKLEILNPDEPVKETKAFLDKNFVTNTTKALLEQCRIYQRGEYIVIDFKDKVYYYEHVGAYCYIEDAIHYMNPEKPAKWKTLERLITFRQALRENTAQGMGLDDLLNENISEGGFTEFITVARMYDKRHHGTVTF
ncbi:MAG: hypothetical protein WAU36_04085 [Cyclobacteriaceae bacterium]